MPDKKPPADRWPLPDPDYDAAPISRAESERWHESVRQDRRETRAEADDDRAEQRADHRNTRDNADLWHHYIRDNLRHRDERMDAIEAKLDANNAATETIVETMQSWTGAMKTIESIGKVLRPLTWIITFIAAVAGLWATIKADLHR